MDHRSHTHEEPFGVTPERMFEALTTPAAIREWFGASKVIVTPEKGGAWIASWDDEAADAETRSDYISSFKILEIEPPKRIVLGEGKYRSSEEKDTMQMDVRTEFLVEPMAGGCSLTVVHHGIPDDPSQNDFYEDYLYGWENTFDGIRKYLFEHS